MGAQGAILGNNIIMMDRLIKCSKVNIQDLIAPAIESENLDILTQLHKNHKATFSKADLSLAKLYQNSGIISYISQNIK